MIIELLLLIESPNGENSSKSFGESTKSSSLIKCCFKSNSDRTDISFEQDRSAEGASYVKLFRKKHRSESVIPNGLTGDETPHSDQHQLGRREITAEARVTRSLAIVIGCFICCWLPFFTLYIIRAVCLCLSFNAIEFFVWLGYSNSAINPVLYAIFKQKLSVSI